MASGMDRLRQMNRSKAAEPGNIYKSGPLTPAAPGGRGGSNINTKLKSAATKPSLRDLGQTSSPVTRKTGANATINKALSAPKPAPRPATPKMSDQDRTLTRLRKDKEFMGAIEKDAAALRASQKPIFKPAATPATSSNCGYDSYKKLMGI